MVWLELKLGQEIGRRKGGKDISYLLGSWHGRWVILLINKGRSSAGGILVGSRREHWLRHR